MSVQTTRSWVFFGIEESNLECWERRKVKVTENCVENTDFAYAATSRPGQMPDKLTARLSGITSNTASTSEPQSYELYLAAVTHDI